MWLKTQREVLPTCEVMDGERDLCKLNRSRSPKLTVEEVAKLENCDRPLTKKDWLEMAIDNQWATLGDMGFLEVDTQDANPTESTTVTINVTTDIPSRAKPSPPQAPGRVRTYSEDPPTRAWRYL